MKKSSEEKKVLKSHLVQGKIVAIEKNRFVLEMLQKSKRNRSFGRGEI